ncbi:MAG: glycosyltransferase family 2 protein [Deltaproteobacteria bacterium]|nr:glycosyltransferase family 2 protein [Deltaproteobacteria bacterium]
MRENKGRKASLSLLMVARDEESCISGALDSVRGLVDEILLVDTGSTDRTVEIAESYGARILHHPWRDDFAEARNAGLAEVTGDYVLILDADEYFEQEGRMALLVFKNVLPIGRRIAVLLDIKSYAGDDPRNKEMALRSAGQRTAIVPVDKAIRFSGRIFEQMDEGLNRLRIERINTTNIYIIHRTDRRAFRRQRKEASLRRSYHDTLRPEDIFQGILFWMESNRPDEALLWFRRTLLEIPYDIKYGAVMADFTSYLNACGALEGDSTVLSSILEKYSRCYRVMTLCSDILIRNGLSATAYPILKALVSPMEGHFDDSILRRDLRNNQLNLAIVAIEREDFDALPPLLEALTKDEDFFDSGLALRFYSSLRQGDIELAVAHLDEIIRKRNLPIDKTLQNLAEFIEVAGEVAEFLIGYGQWQAGNILIRSLEHLAGVLDSKKGISHAETSVR